MRKTNADDTHGGNPARTSYCRTGHDDSSASRTVVAAESHIDHTPHGDRTVHDPSI